MLDVGTDSGEMMTVSTGFGVIHVVCLWICVLLGILREPTSLVEFEKETIYWLVGVRKERDFRSIMGTIKRIKFF